jgi:hypothetical protein
VLKASNRFLVPLGEGFVEDLKFGQCLSDEMTAAELRSRFNVDDEIRKISSFTLNKLSDVQSVKGAEKAISLVSRSCTKTSMYDSLGNPYDERSTHSGWFRSNQRVLG